jgi:transcriptional regulator of aromatic amino acid metabolism
MPEYFSILCKDRIEVRRGILDILVLHSLDLKNKMRFICFNYVFVLLTDLKLNHVI